MNGPNSMAFLLGQGRGRRVTLYAGAWRPPEYLAAEELGTPDCPGTAKSNRWVSTKSPNSTAFCHMGRGCGRRERFTLELGDRLYLYLYQVPP